MSAEPKEAPKRRNPVARELANPLFRRRVVKDRKRYRRNEKHRRTDKSDGVRISSPAR